MEARDNAGVDRKTRAVEVSKVAVPSTANPDAEKAKRLQFKRGLIKGNTNNLCFVSSTLNALRADNALSILASERLTTLQGTADGTLMRILSDTCVDDNLLVKWTQQCVTTSKDGEWMTLRRQSDAMRASEESERLSDERSARLARQLAREDGQIVDEPLSAPQIETLPTLAGAHSDGVERVQSAAEFINDLQEATGLLDEYRVALQTTFTCTTCGATTTKNEETLVLDIHIEDDIDANLEFDTASLVAALSIEEIVERRCDSDADDVRCAGNQSRQAFAVTTAPTNLLVQMVRERFNEPMVRNRVHASHQITLAGAVYERVSVLHYDDAGIGHWYAERAYGDNGQSWICNSSVTTPQGADKAWRDQDGRATMFVYRRTKAEIIEPTPRTVKAVQHESRTQLIDKLADGSSVAGSILDDLLDMATAKTSVDGVPWHRQCSLHTSVLGDSDPTQRRSRDEVQKQLHEKLTATKSHGLLTLMYDAVDKHWRLAIASRLDAAIIVVDSMSDAGGTSANATVVTAAEALRATAEKAWGETCSIKWLGHQQGVAQQPLPSYDCGPFCVWFAEQIIKQQEQEAAPLMCDGKIRGIHARPPNEWRGQLAATVRNQPPTRTQKRIAPIVITSDDEEQVGGGGGGGDGGGGGGGDGGGDSGGGGGNGGVDSGCDSGNDGGNDSTGGGNGRGGRSGHGGRGGRGGHGGKGGGTGSGGGSNGGGNGGGSKSGGKNGRSNAMAAPSNASAATASAPPKRTHCKHAHLYPKCIGSKKGYENEKWLLKHEAKCSKAYDEWRLLNENVAAKANTEPHRDDRVRHARDPDVTLHDFTNRHGSDRIAFSYIADAIEVMRTMDNSRFERLAHAPARPSLLTPGANSNCEWMSLITAVFYAMTDPIHEWAATRLFSVVAHIVLHTRRRSEPVMFATQREDRLICLRIGHLLAGSAGFESVLVAYERCSTKYEVTCTRLRERWESNEKSTRHADEKARQLARKNEHAAKLVRNVSVHKAAALLGHERGPAVCNAVLAFAQKQEHREYAILGTDAPTHYNDSPCGILPPPPPPPRVGDERMRAALAGDDPPPPCTPAIDDDAVQVALDKALTRVSSLPESGIGDRHLLLALSRLEADKPNAGALRSAIGALAKRILGVVNPPLCDTTRQTLLACRAVAIPKPVAPGAPQDIRPISVPETLLKVVAVLAQNGLEKIMSDELASTQCGVGMPNGTASIVFTTRALLAKHVGWAVVSTDARNAYGSMSRQVLLHMLLRSGTRLGRVRAYLEFAYGIDTEQYVRAATDTYRAPSSTSNEGAATTRVAGNEADNQNNGTWRITSREGVRQGDTLAPFAYTYLHARVVEATARETELRYGWRHGRDYVIPAYIDDAYVIGAPRTAVIVHGIYKSNLKRIMNVDTNLSKVVFYARTATDMEHMREAARKCNEIENTHYKCSLDGIKVCGSPVGSKEYTTAFLTAAMPKFERHALAAAACAEDFLHEGLQILRLSVAARLLHLARTVPPTWLVDAIGDRQTMTMDTVAAVLVPVGNDIPPDVRALLAHPPANGGIGFTRLRDVCEAAYAACALETVCSGLGDKQHITEALGANEDAHTLVFGLDGAIQTVYETLRGAVAAGGADELREKVNDKMWTHRPIFTATPLPWTQLLRTPQAANHLPSEDGEPGRYKPHLQRRLLANVWRQRWCNIDTTMEAAAKAAPKPPGSTTISTASVDPRVRHATLRAVANSRCANVWIHTMPTDEALRLTNEELRHAIATRYGLPLPAFEQVAAGSYCKATNGHTRCGKLIATGKHHRCAFKAKQLRWHNGITDETMSMLHAAQVQAHITKENLLRPTASVYGFADAASVQAMASGVGANQARNAAACDEEEEDDEEDPDRYDDLSEDGLVRDDGDASGDANKKNVRHRSSSSSSSTGDTDDADTVTANKRDMSSATDDLDNNNNTNNYERLLPAKCAGESEGAASEVAASGRGGGEQWATQHAAHGARTVSVSATPHSQLDAQRARAAQMRKIEALPTTNDLKQARARARATAAAEGRRLRQSKADRKPVKLTADFMTVVDGRREYFDVTAPDALSNTNIGVRTGRMVTLDNVLKKAEDDKRVNYEHATVPVTTLILTEHGHMNESLVLLIKNAALRAEQVGLCKRDYFAAHWVKRLVMRNVRLSYLLAHETASAANGVTDLPFGNLGKIGVGAKTRVCPIFVSSLNTALPNGMDSHAF